MGAVRTTLTMEEFLALPELPAGKRELLRGELIELPPAKLKHDKIAHRLYERLKLAIAAAGLGGEVYHEVGYQMGPRHWLKPDLSVTHPDQAAEDYLLGAPLLAIEIVSAGNTAEEINDKTEAYHAFGAKEVWVLYPERRHLWVYSAEISAQRHSGRFVSQLLNGETIDLDQIWVS